MKLTHEGRRLVDDARAGYGPTSSDRERVLSALSARVAAAGGAAAASSGGSAAASLSGVAAAKGTIIGIVAVVALGAVSIGYWRAGRSVDVTPPPAPPSAVREQARALAPTASAPPPSSAPAEAARERPHRAKGEPARGEAPSPPRALRAAARAPAPLAATLAPRPVLAPAPLATAPEPRPNVAPASIPDGVREPRPDVAPEPSPDVAGEVALLTRAQKALADGDFRRGLRLLDRHEATFPHGMLAEERGAARIIALCGLGRVETARQEIATFLSKAPASPLAERVKHACGAAWPDRR